MLFANCAFIVVLSGRVTNCLSSVINIQMVLDHWIMLFCFLLCASSVHSLLFQIHCLNSQFQFCRLPSCQRIRTNCLRQNSKLLANWSPTSQILHSTNCHDQIAHLGLEATLIGSRNSHHQRTRRSQICSGNERHSQNSHTVFSIHQPSQPI